MDFGLDKKIELVENDENGRILSVIDEVKHLGHESLQIGNLSIKLTGLGEWNISNLKVYYINNTNKTEITNCTKKESEGILEVEIPSNFSEKIQLNDIISLEYNLLGAPKEENKKYKLDLRATAITKSGTPVDKKITEEIEIPGLKPEEEEISAGAAPEIMETAQIMKISAESKFITNSMIENEVSFKIVDTGNKGIRNPSLFLYLPENSRLYLDKINITLIKEGIKESLDIEIEETGIKIIGDKDFLEYTIYKKTEPTEVFGLYDGDIIKIKYRLEIPLGTSEIITRAYGYNYYEDKYIFEDEITKIRREYWKLKNLVTKEDKFEGKKILVGKPVEWMKVIEIYNPNEKDIKDMYTTKVFDDRLNVKVLESRNGSTKEIKVEKEDKDTIDFFVDINAKERITYFVFVNTPPVLEIKRDTNILEIKNESVKVEVNITLKNFAKYDYEEIYFELLAQNILECNFEYFFIENKTEIKIPKIKSLENVTLYIIYEEEPPILRVYIDKLKYDCNEKANLTTLVVQGGKKGYLEIEINGPEKSLDTIYADLISLEKTGEKINTEIELGGCKTGNYTLYGYYKSNFHPILITKESFSVECKEVFELHWVVFSIGAIVIIIVLLRKIYRRKTLEEEIEELKT